MAPISSEERTEPLPPLLKQLGRGIRQALAQPDNQELPAEMKQLLAKLDNMLADKETVSASERSGKASLRNPMQPPLVVLHPDCRRR